VIGQSMIMKVDSTTCLGVKVEHFTRQFWMPFPSAHLRLRGCALVAVAHDGQEAELPVAVVRETNGKSPFLFGVYWLEKIRSIGRSCSLPRILKSLEYCTVA
jgi:hypothetical protein